MNREWAGGKGDARRRCADDKKYKAGWDRIWSGSSHVDTEKDSESRKG